MSKSNKSASELSTRQYGSILKKSMLFNLALPLIALPAYAGSSRLTPSNAPIVQVNTVNMSNHLFTAVGQHLRNSDLANKATMPVSSVMYGTSLWGSGYYGQAKLKDRPNSKGIEPESMGGIVAMDKKLNPHTTWGIGYQYDNSDIDGYKRKTKTYTNTGFIYANYSPSNMFVNGIVSYGRSTLKGKNFAWRDSYGERERIKHNVFKGKYHADIWGMQGLTGYKYALQMVDMTPQVGLRYNYIRRHGYNDGTDQQISGKNMDIFTGVIGVTLSKDLYWHDCLKFRPELYGGMTYDFISDRDNAVVWTSDGDRYVIDGKRLNKIGYQVGAGITSELTEKLSLNIGYNGNFRKHFHDNTGILGLSYAM
ncbi:MAG: autotransporter outer membrane beta-barrel domain-containing protein [Alphaproteobacteria bacterium]|nr:autotransporter outer membrane beta-barrel domain-containing protein [Alphaproteobacteria bacterium]